MTTNPVVTCVRCGAQRDCTLHTRAEFPPDAAKKWLRKQCPTRQLCEFTYRAGISLSRLDVFREEAS